MRFINKKINQRLFVIAFLIGWLGSTITPLIDSVKVTSEYDLTAHRLGFPLPIIEQNTSLTPLEDALPFELGMVNPKEHPTKLIIGIFLYILVGIGIYIFISLITIIIVKIKRDK